MAFTSSKYPWYTVVQGAAMEQGDLLCDCPVLTFPPDLSAERWIEAAKGGASPEVFVEVRTYDVIVMSHSCDLAHNRVGLVLLCRHYGLSEFEQRYEQFQHKRQKEKIRQGNVHAYHMLNGCDIEGYKTEIRIVDFKGLFGLPLPFLREIAEARGRRLRLLPPYREHLAQAFARYFMRVGLPVDIPRFA